MYRREVSMRMLSCTHTTEVVGLGLGGQVLGVNIKSRQASAIYRCQSEHMELSEFLLKPEP